jgi:hypothetical protein
VGRKSLTGIGREAGVAGARWVVGAGGNKGVRLVFMENPPELRVVLSNRAASTSKSSPPVWCRSAGLDGRRSVEPSRCCVKSESHQRVEATHTTQEGARRH